MASTMHMDMDRADIPVVCKQVLRDLANVTELVQELNAASAHLFDEALRLQHSHSQYNFLLATVLEAQLLKRNIFRALFASSACVTVKTDLAENANTIGVLLQLLRHYSYARRWFELARDSAFEGSIAEAYALLNLDTIEQLDESASRSSTPVHADTDSGGDAPAGAALSAEDMLFAITTNEVLERARQVLHCLNGQPTGARA